MNKFQSKSRNDRFAKNTSLFVMLTLVDIISFVK